MCFLSTGLCVVPTASTHVQKQHVVIAAAGCFCCECSKLRAFVVNLIVVVQQLPASVEIAAAAAACLLCCSPWATCPVSSCSCSDLAPGGRGRQPEHLDLAALPRKHVYCIERMLSKVIILHCLKVQLPCPVACPVTCSMSSSTLDMAMSSPTLDMPPGMSSCTPATGHAWTCSWTSR